jgi:hypothetical protein
VLGISGGNGGNNAFTSKISCIYAHKPCIITVAYIYDIAETAI